MAGSERGNHQEAGVSRVRIEKARGGGGAEEGEDDLPDMANLPLGLPALSLIRFPGCSVQLYFGNPEVDAGLPHSPGRIGGPVPCPCQDATATCWGLGKAPSSTGRPILKPPPLSSSKRIAGVQRRELRKICPRAHPRLIIVHDGPAEGHVIDRGRGRRIAGGKLCSLQPPPAKRGTKEG